MARKHKGALTTLRHMFRRRNIIVMCEKSVDHYPIDGKLQLGLLVAVIGGFSWVSYSTGGYMAAQSVLKQKDQQIVSTAVANKRIGEEYSLLKQDLIKLQEHDGELGEYAKFIIDQHADNKDVQLAETFALAALDGAKGSDDDRLMQRVSYLEAELESLREANENIVAEVQRRTGGKIRELEEVIHLTGLNKARLQKSAAADMAREADIAANAEQNDSKEFEAQGGPYIPEQTAALDPKLSRDLDRLMVLNHIIEKLPLSMPVDHPRITSGFGRRIDPFTRRWAVHSGQDFVGVSGARVVAPAAGRVLQAGRSGAYGNLVEIDHGMGVTTRYGHLSRIAVKPGQKIAAGDLLGRQGTTGRSTGQHVHYEVRYLDRPIDPRKFLKAGTHVQKSEAQTAHR